MTAMPSTKSTFIMGLSFVLLLFASPMVALSAAADPANLHHSAASAYVKGDFQTARDTWLSIVEDHGLAADLFYNLGNASYRLGNLGEAALWYQRALVIDPAHAESRQNLKVIERQVGNMKLEWNFLQNFADTLTRRQLIHSATIGFWALALSLAFTSCVRIPRMRPVNLIARVLGVALLAFSITTLLVRRSPQSLRDRSIVTTPGSTARTAPADDSKEIIALPPGTEVDRIAERAAWSYVAIPGDLRGWVRAEETESLWPYDASFLR